MGAMIREASQSERMSAYSAVGMIRTSWDGVTWWRGSYSMVGVNDVLTALHVVYNPSLGGWARHVELFPAADFNGVTNRFEDRPYSVGAFEHRAWGLPDRVFSDASHDTVLFSESQYDVAVLGLSIPLGLQTGWYDLNPGHNDGVNAQAIGYPGGSTGMMVSQVHTWSAHVWGIYTSEFEMGPGSSGGPLMVGNEVIGVKSGASPAMSVFADIGFLYPQLLNQIDANNDLLGAASMASAQDDWLVGTSGADDIRGLAGADRLFGLVGDDLLRGDAGDDYIDGGPGRDIAVYGLARSQYQISRDGANGIVTVAARSGSDGADQLANVERLQFSDGWLALDFTGTAGQSYRLYQAAFDRTPDLPGLSFWIRALDQGRGDLVWAANFFAHSPEWLSRYGQTSTADFITRLYANVLDRAPDPGGYQFWSERLQSQAMSRAEMLAFFSESPENQANVVGVIQNGIWYS